MHDANVGIRSFHFHRPVLCFYRTSCIHPPFSRLATGNTPSRRGQQKLGMSRGDTTTSLRPPQYISSSYTIHLDRKEPGRKHDVVITTGAGYMTDRPGSSDSLSLLALRTHDSPADLFGCGGRQGEGTETSRLQKQVEDDDKKRKLSLAELLTLQAIAREAATCPYFFLLLLPYFVLTIALCMRRTSPPTHAGSAVYIKDSRCSSAVNHISCLDFVRGTLHDDVTRLS